MGANIDMLNRVPLFALLDKSERQTLVEVVRSKRFAAGQQLFRRGDVGDALYVVASGKVEISLEDLEGRTIVLAEYGQGEVFGEIALFDGGARTATATATEDAETLILDREGTFQLISQHPHAALDLLAVMGQRLRAADDRLVGLATRNANEVHDDQVTFGQYLADRVAAFGGSWIFIGCFSGLLTLWVAINGVLLVTRAFDPYPFILLNLVLSLLAAMQAPVIMMAQNRQSDKDRLKAELDYQINLKAEHEVAHLHTKVDRLYEELQAHFAKLERESVARNGHGST